MGEEKKQNKDLKSASKIQLKNLENEEHLNQR